MVASKVLTLRVEPYHTIHAVKEMICFETGCELSDRIGLICRGKHLKDNQTLGYYNIKDFDSLFVAFSCEGGGGGVRKNNVTKIESKTFKYYAAIPGLMYAGKCNNSNCDVYNEKILVGKGFGEIRPNEDQAEGFMTCPGFFSYFFFVFFFEL